MQMTYIPVPFEVHGYWAWPTDWDGESDFLIFDCPALWVDMRDYHRLERGHGTDDFNVHINGDVMTCWLHTEDGRRNVWKLTDEHDTKNHAQLMVWPD